MTESQEKSRPADEQAVNALYFKLLDAWNRRSAGDFAALFEDGSHVVGFDGSMMNGRAEIESTLHQIFNDHQTAAYIARVRGIDFPAKGVALLRAVCGMIPPGQKEINPAVNAVQSLLAVRRSDHWSILLFQNTPAQFHGRPDLSAALTEELRELQHN